ncbi:MAG TPA: DNA-formamidopyrimidine glycosylase family protein [Jatrophihabitantaceae bacterium]|nr:DNA-formamidopyrimidine glycosylase family protein [Jatrophihabitantaceae bacterium]
MPEGDTVWLTAKRLHDALVGRIVTTFDLRVPELATCDLAGDTVLEVIARGKHILIRFAGGLTLHNHLRMDGSWRIVAAGRRPGALPAHMIRALIGNDTWTAAGYRVHDLRLVHAADEARLVGHLGPDLLGPDWDPDTAVGRLRARTDRPVGEALLDQRNLAGIGNLYKCEALFVERTNPWTQVGNVADLRRLVVTAQRLMRVNRDHPEQSTTGMSGRGREHWVYRRAGSACRRCRTPIRHEIQGAAPYQRDTFWCPTCQPAR